MDANYAIAVKRQNGEVYKMWVEDRKPNIGDFVLCEYDGRLTTGLVLAGNSVDDNKHTRWEVTLKTIDQFFAKTYPHKGGRWLGADKIRPLSNTKFSNKHKNRLAAIDRAAGRPEQRTVYL